MRLKLKKIQNKTLFLIILAVFVVTRLPFFCSGLLPLEPDEQDHQYWAISFKNHQWPIVYETTPYFEQVPLYSYLASFIPQKATCPFFEVRLLSAVSTLIAVFILFHLLKSLNRLLAFFASLIFLFSPLVMFYSKTGVLDMAMMAALLTSFYFLLKSKTRRSMFLAGLFYGLAVLFKTAALYFGLIFLFEFIYHWKKTSQLHLSLFLTSLLGFMAVVVSVFLAFVFRFKQLNPDTPLQLFYVPNVHLLPLTNLTVHLATIWEYIKQSFFLLGILAPVFIISLPRLFSSLKKPLDRFTLWAILATLIFLTFFTFSPRYLLYLSPYLVLSLSLFFYEKFNKLLFYLLFFLFLLPSSWLAFQSLDHQIFEDTASFINQRFSSQTLIHSSYIPEKLKRITQHPVIWLDTNNLKPGDLILIEELRSRDFASFGPNPHLKQDIKFIRSHLKPIFQLRENTPNFPYTKDTNTLELYFYEAQG